MKKIFSIFWTLLLFSNIIFSTAKAQCACCAGAGLASSNGDYNNGVLNLPKNKWLAEVYGDYRSIQNGGAPEDEEKLLTNLFIGSAGIRYGLNKNITISALLPYVILYTNNGQDKGVGDMNLLATIKLKSANNLNIAVQAGLELPTGIQKASTFDNTTVVVGSGSFDPMLGLVVAKKWEKISLQGNALFKYTTPGFNKNNYGSVSVQNMSVAYALKGNGNICSTDSVQKKKLSISILGGYYGEWVGKIKEDGMTDDNSGYYAGYFNLGSNFSYKGFSLPITASLPVFSVVNGIQNSPGFRIRIGLIKSF